VLFALPYAANVGTRFLIPSLPFLSLALGLGLSLSQGLTPLLIIAHGILAWPPVLNRYTDNVWRIERVPHKPALRLVPEEQFLSERLDGYAAARMIDDCTPAAARVFSFSPVPEAYSSRDLLIGFQSAEGETIRDMLLVPLAEDFPPVHRFDLKFPARALKAIRVRQTTLSGTDIWSITEVRVFSGTRELPPAPTWQSRSRPNPWDAGFALDRNPATRWRSWQALDARMYFEVDFGHPLTVDMVRVEASGDQWQAKMALEGVDAQGAMQQLGPFPDQAKAPPVEGLRRWAARAVRGRGVEYLAVFDHDFTAKDMRERPAAWGLKPVCERAGVRLYRIE
jgi:hypothetical protein